MLLNFRLQAKKNLCLTEATENTEEGLWTDSTILKIKRLLCTGPSSASTNQESPIPFRAFHEFREKKRILWENLCLTEITEHTEEGFIDG